MSDNNVTSNKDRLQQVRLLRGQAASALQKNNLEKAQHLLALAKSLRTPLENIDYLRALIFLKKGETGTAKEALKEELRFFPDNTVAKQLLSTIDTNTYTMQGSEEFIKICNEILPYTMVGPLRLKSLYDHAIDICKNGPDGNFVECGVAGGGTSGLLSAVIKQYSPFRRLFSCDSFSGLPAATAEDTDRNGCNASEQGWGAGTCAAPESCVLGLCDKLGTREIITTIKGFFEDTLPIQADSFGPIAFLHMDGDWYSSTKTILESLYDKLVAGAYIQVDDYGHWAGCKKAVEEFCISKQLNFSINRIDESGIWFTK